MAVAWKAVAVDALLSAQFNIGNIERVRDGSAPCSTRIDQIGGRKTFELHHKIEISKDGAVYDLDNLLVMTPKRHIKLHKGNHNDLS